MNFPAAFYTKITSVLPLFPDLYRIPTKMDNKCAQYSQKFICGRKCSMAYTAPTFAQLTVCQ